VALCGGFESRLCFLFVGRECGLWRDREWLNWAMGSSEEGERGGDCGEADDWGR
jgi:hypothetical protein